MQKTGSQDHTTDVKYSTRYCTSRTAKQPGLMAYQGNIYKILHKHLGEFQLEITNRIMHGDAIPENWTEGAIVHIHEKGDKLECANYRAIFLTQLIYKIWSKLLTGRLAKILHLLTPSTQYGYKSGLSTIDAIIKFEHEIKTGTSNLTLVLMDLSKAFDCANRTLLWNAIYKKGLPIPMIQHIRQGHQNTTLRRKDNGEYGLPVKNNVGVFQGSALSALLFIIYLDEVIQDYQALNDEAKLPQRHTIQTAAQTHTNNLLGHIKNMNNNENDTQQPKNDPRRENNQNIYDSNTREDGIIYADGTNIIAEHDTPSQLATRLKNYEIATTIRRVSIQWEKSK